jgi:ankyrin repeat protein
MNSNTKTFFKAITSFNVNLEAVTQALGDDPTLLNATNHNGLVPIQVAANRGLKPLIRIIVGYGADIEVATKDGRTPVVIACQGGSLYAVHVFNECGANMDVRDSYGRTLMHHAAATGAVHLMHYLNVKCGLRHDEKDNEGYTPLHLACWNSHTETVRYLLKHKVNQNSINNNHIKSSRDVVM